MDGNGSSFLKKKSAQFTISLYVHNVLSKNNETKIELRKGLSFPESNPIFTFCGSEKREYSRHVAEFDIETTVFV